MRAEVEAALERAGDSWSGRPYPVGPGVSQEFARAVQDRTLLAREVERLQGLASDKQVSLNALYKERIDELEDVLSNVLLYLQRSQFLVGADALREDIEAVLR